MFFLKSFNKTVSAGMLFTTLMTIIIIGSVLLIGEIIKYKQEADELSKIFYENQKEKAQNEVNQAIEYIEYRKDYTKEELEINLKKRVYEAYNVAESIYTKYKEKLNKPEIINLIKEALRPVRFNDGRGYFFIYDMYGNNILLPPSPQMEGTNLINLKDSKGLYTIQRAIKLVNSSEEGFMEWHWFHPEKSEEMLNKIGFMKGFSPYNWFIGTGEYIEDFTVDVKKETLKWIRKIRFEKYGYIFVIDKQGNILAHHDKTLIDQNLYDYQDSNGIYIVRELIKISKLQYGGFLNYNWVSRPQSNEPGDKIAFTNNIEDWEWTVGAGIYVDEINNILKLKQKELITKITKDLITIFLVLIVSLLFTLRISVKVADAITDNINSFNEFFEKSADHAVKINEDNIKFNEFRKLAHSANMMTDERNRTEKALSKIQEQLLRSRKMEALGLLAGGVAHDLNNVLSAVIGYPELILESLEQNDPHRKYIQTIHDSGKKAAAIVEDLLALARRGVPQPVLLNLNSIISQYMESPEHAETLLLHSNITVKKNLDDNLLNIRGSEIHIQKSIMNLVLNAAEAIPEGGIISITTENYYAEKSITGYQQIQEGEYVLLKIKDNGHGISSEDLEHIFEPFFTKKIMGRSGTGLGMAIVWGTIQDHNGAIHIETEKNKGTEFQLYFPAVREEIIPESSQLSRISYSGNGEKILVIDDIEEQRDLSCAILKRLGYNAEAVCDADSAVDFVQNNQTDLIVLDMILKDPEVDGFETYKRILEIKPEQKAVIASGYAENERVIETIELGAGTFIKKPYTIERLGLAVKEELNKEYKKKM